MFNKVHFSGCHWHLCWNLTAFQHGWCTFNWMKVILFALQCVKFPFYLCFCFFSPAASIAESQGGHGRDRALYFEDLSECQWSQARGEILMTSYAQGLNPMSRAYKTKSKSFFISVHPSVLCVTYAEFKVPYRIYLICEFAFGCHDKSKTKTAYLSIVWTYKNKPGYCNLIHEQMNLIS